LRDSTTSLSNGSPHERRLRSDKKPLLYHGSLDMPSKLTEDQIQAAAPAERRIYEYTGEVLWLSRLYGERDGSEMIGRTKRSWQYFKRSKPGDRFQVRYYYRKQRGAGRISRIFNIVVGSVLVIFSAFFGWAPGLGTITFVIGLAMVGGEFLPVARFLDWAEVKLRKLAHFVARVWRASVAGKVLIIAVVLICVAALGYGVYYLFFRG
jgi:hypothetical protein